MSWRKKQKRISPYANIDWQKAAKFFQSERPKPVKASKITAGVLLRVLAQAADKGLMFVAHAADPAIVEYILEGSGPLTWETRHMINRFKKQRYATVVEKPDGTVTVRVTKHGLVRALSYQLDKMHIAPLKRWDGKWRVVIFDVPERYHRLRDIFRMRLKQLGLYPLQLSVYVSPYPCFDEVEFLRELYGIAFTVRYLLVEKIEDDSLLRRQFHLR